jgi:pimeloyl-ACP methyl ester carboxylesterase
MTTFVLVHGGWHGDDLRDVVLAGHSSGGAVITGVAQRRPERLRSLVYLDAFVLQPGRSVFAILAPQRRQFFADAVDAAGRIVLDPDALMDGWAITDPDDRAWVGPRLRPHPVGALADPLPLDPLPDVPRTFVHCTVKPAGDSFAATAAALRDDPAWRVDELATGHDAMVTAPKELAELLLRS